MIIPTSTKKNWSRLAAMSDNHCDVIEACWPMTFWKHDVTSASVPLMSEPHAVRSNPVSWRTEMRVAASPILISVSSVNMIQSLCLNFGTYYVFNNTGKANPVLSNQSRPIYETYCAFNMRYACIIPNAKKNEVPSSKIELTKVLPTVPTGHKRRSDEQASDRVL